MVEIINNIEGQDKLVKVSFIKGILEKIYKWSPLKQLNNGSIVQTDKNGYTTNKTSQSGEIALGQYNETSDDALLSVGIGLSDTDRKNALEVRRDGMIYIITDVKSNTVSSLQDALNKKGTTLCQSYEEMLSYVNSDSLGTLLYLASNSEYEGEQYNPGLYVVSMDLISMSPILSKLGTTSTTEVDYGEDIDQLKSDVVDLTDRVEDLEDWVDSPIEEDELNNILNKN